MDAENLFQMYPKLAQRVTNLRTIIQNPSTPITAEDRKAWSEDVKSVLADSMTLFEMTAQFLQTIPKE
jgi:hypothetical protein